MNIPFIEALERIRSYVKFMKEILSNKRRLKEHEKIQMNKNCSAIVQRKLLIRQDDLGSFIIPCTVGNIMIEGF